MFAPLAKHIFPSRGLSRFASKRAISRYQVDRFKSTSAQSDEMEESPRSCAFDKNGESTAEVVSFPSSTAGTIAESKPVILNSKEHAVGYLGRVLNARVYDAAIETELQEATNLSAVSTSKAFWRRASFSAAKLLIVPRLCFEIPAFEKQCASQT